MKALIRAMRPEQWSKNVFVLAPLVFALGDERSEQPIDVVGALVACAAFCLVSSAVYLLNDVLDVERDRAHPEKCRRPIASGALSVRTALGAAAGLALAAFAAAAWIDGGLGSVAGVLGLYVGINVAYGLRLKHIVLVDAFCIASGFLLRVEAGGAAAGVAVSHWLFLCTLFLALFLALNKRRAEIVLLGDDRGAHRANLEEYSLGFLDQMVGVLAACTIVCYTMYTVGDETASKFGDEGRLVWSVPFVAFGIGRYMVLVQGGRGGDNPARILLGGDLPFLFNALAWAGTVGWALFL